MDSNDGRDDFPAALSNCLMNRFLLALLCLLTASFPAPSSAQKPLDKDTKSITSLVSLQQQWKAAEDSANAAAEKLPDTPDKDDKVRQLGDDLDSKQADLSMQAVERAKANPTADATLEVLLWLMDTVRTYHIPAGVPCMEILREHHAENPKIGPAIATLASYPPYDKAPSHHQAIDLLKTVYAKNPDRVIRGYAAFGLAMVAKRRFEKAALEEPASQSRLFDDTIKALEKVSAEFGDCTSLPRPGSRKFTKTIGDEVKLQTTDLRTSLVGKEAPEIVGEDLDDKPMKLSEHRSKVVLLVFWGSWCGPCMSDVPHEIELVKRFKGRPFVLVGVNSDGNRTDATKAVAKNQIPWRSFWNGPDGSRGSISTAWNVHSWPHLCIIDDQGIIRSRRLRGDELDQPLEMLISEAEKRTSKEK